jgi:hypothetical protein
MTDTLRQLGKTIGSQARSAQILQRRGGYLPSVERTRGMVTVDIEFISPFVINEQNRRLSLALDFTRSGQGGVGF